MTELRGARSEPILASNEVGLGVAPADKGARASVDARGSLNQQAAVACERVTLAIAGLALRLKGPA
jgi:adenosylcobinamide kinase/adenosylcobinamide-phosphate guanylyltransferase